VIQHLLVLAAGVGLAAVGGELFVRGTVGLAAWARVPAALAGATVAAFATSSPELSVGIQAATTGRPELAIGDALGSNVLNVGLVLGVVVALGPLAASRAGLGRDLAVAVAAPALTLVALVDGRLTRAEGVVLLAVFAGWLAAVGRQALRERATAEDVEAEEALAEAPGRRAVVSALLGLVALVAAGRAIVVAAKGIGTDLDLDPFVVGATLVALGTSTPELATALVARRRHHAEVGVGTILGSNVFNNLWIVGIVAVIQPARMAASEVVLAVVAGIGALGLAVPRHDGVLPRWRGPALLALTVAYVSLTIALGG
jgi:cation:H+ antiporter